MERIRVLAFTSGVAGIVALGLSAPVLAKVKQGQSEPASGQISLEPSSNNAGAGQSLSEAVLADAVRLCQLVVDDSEATVDALENGGWTHEIDYNVGNAPFYKELGADFFYEDVGAAEIWGFVEEYPGYYMGYCSFKISDPEIRFSITPLTGVEGFVEETQISGEEVFGTWRDDSDTPTSFIHVYHNSDTFSYQITRLHKD